MLPRIRYGTVSEFLTRLSRLDPVVERFVDQTLPVDEPGILSYVHTVASSTDTKL